MKRILLAGLSLLLLNPAYSQPEPAPQPQFVRAQLNQEPDEAGMAVIELIERLAREMNTEFIYSPATLRGVAMTTAGANADFDSLRGILRESGLVAIQLDDQIHVVQEANIRSLPSRVLNEDDRRVSDHEIVTRVITLPEMSEDGSGPVATQLVPILRPMMPQNAQLGAPANSNSLIIVDYYDNVRRMTEVIETLIQN
jgi:general secretion pathway protein D